jgi:hypothetical protein
MSCWASRIVSRHFATPLFYSTPFWMVHNKFIRLEYWNRTWLYTLNILAERGRRTLFRESLSSWSLSILLHFGVWVFVAYKNGAFIRETDALGSLVLLG